MSSSAPRVPSKWRPKLALIVFLSLGAVLSLPLASLIFFRIYENQIIRQTESELIAESAMLGAVFKRRVETQFPLDVPLGAAAPPPEDERFQPVLPSLDLAAIDPAPRRPPASTASAAPHPAFKALGAELSALAQEAQRVTLAGFRILDPDGVVIAGRDEIGLSLAHVEEVAAALRGETRSAIRQRVSEHPAPPLYSISRGAGARIFVAMPVVARGKIAGVVYASRTPNDVFKSLYAERGKAAAAGALMLSLTLLIGFVLHRTVMRPVRELIARTTAIGRGEKNALAPLQHHGTEEFALLAQSFLDMAASLNMRGDYISTFAAHVSHELKSPLTAIRGAAELLRDDVGAGHMNDEERRRFLGNIIADAARLSAIAGRLRELARAEASPTAGVTALAPVIAELASAFPKLTVRAEGDTSRPFRMSAENLRIALAHLADNAERHGAARLTLSAATENGVLRIVARDDGRGVSPGNREKIFDSFFTTRRDCGGTGMGLAIVRAMLGAHGGTIELLGSGEGAAFAITLPLHTNAPEY